MRGWNGIDCGRCWVVGWYSLVGSGVVVCWTGPAQDGVSGKGLVRCAFFSFLSCLALPIFLFFPFSFGFVESVSLEWSPRAFSLFVSHRFRLNLVFFPLLRLFAFLWWWWTFDYSFPLALCLCLSILYRMLSCICGLWSAEVLFWPGSLSATSIFASSFYPPSRNIYQKCEKSKMLKNRSWDTWYVCTLKTREEEGIPYVSTSSSTHRNTRLRVRQALTNNTPIFFLFPTPHHLLPYNSLALPSNALTISSTFSSASCPTAYPSAGFLN